MTKIEELELIKFDRDAAYDAAAVLIATEGHASAAAIRASARALAAQERVERLVAELVQAGHYDG